jgi:hypothetical protein
MAVRGGAEGLGRDKQQEAPHRAADLHKRCSAGRQGPGFGLSGNDGNARKNS